MGAKEVGWFTTKNYLASTIVLVTLCVTIVILVVNVNYLFLIFSSKALAINIQITAGLKLFSAYVK